MEELRFEIAEDMEDERIDKCISLLVEELSRSFIQKLIKDGNVLVNGKPVKGSFRVKCEDEVVFSVPESVERNGGTSGSGTLYRYTGECADVSLWE